MLKLLFGYEGDINRKQYLLANVYILLIALIFGFISGGVWMVFPSLTESTLSTIGMIIFTMIFIPSWIMVVTKRGRDFGASQYLIYSFIGIICVGTCFDFLDLFFAQNYIFNILYWIINGIWAIFYLIFQFKKTKVLEASESL